MSNSRSWEVPQSRATDSGTIIKESPQAFAAFQFYLRQGPSRSVTKAFYASKGGKVKLRSTAKGALRPSSRWSDWSRLWSWKARAEEYDRVVYVEQRILREKTLEHIRSGALIRADEVLEALRQVAMGEVKASGPQVQAIRTYLLEIVGLESAQKVEISGIFTDGRLNMFDSNKALENENTMASLSTDLLRRMQQELESKRSESAVLEGEYIDKSQ